MTNDTTIAGVPKPTAAVEFATQINAAHRAFQTSARASLGCARKCGELLVKAKSEIPHGTWLEWLKANIRCTPRTCQYYMKVAANWDALSKNETVSLLTLKCAVKLLRPEKPARYMDVTEFNSERHQSLLRFVKEAVATVRWKGAYDLMKNEEQSAEALEEKAAKVRDKARRARQRAEMLKANLEHALREEFEKQHPVAEAATA